MSVDKLTEEAPRNPTIYGEVILWERPIQEVAKRFIRPGDVVLDVGGNTGGLAIAFSRMTGGSGRVLSFECNPKMIKWIQQDCHANGIGNVEVVPHAAYSESGKVLDFFLDETFYSSSSSVIPTSGRRHIRVSTVTLDETIHERRIVPTFVKIDVEGAEASVLEGAERLLREIRAVLVLEYSHRGTNFIPKLWSLGYRLWDVNTYRPVDESYFNQHFATNVVAVPEEMGRYEFSPKGDTQVLEVDVSTSGDGVAKLMAWSSGAPERALLAMAQAPFAHLQHHSCASIVLPAAAAAVIELETIEGEGNASIRGVRRYCVDFRPGHSTRS